MNDRPFATTPMPQTTRLEKKTLNASAWIRMRHTLLHSTLLLLTCCLLSACWGDDQTTPAPSDQAATPPLSALPTSAPVTSDAPAATEIVSEATPEGIAALLSTPEITGEVESSAPITAPAQPPTPTVVPLEAAEGSNCDIESSLDLVGYPNLEKVMGCPIAPANTSPVAINEFGDADKPTDRFMLWFGDERKIYVLLPDGSYQSYDDTWEEGKDPTFSCNPSGGVEDSPPLPRRGFGKLWCSKPELQTILGTVPREERLCQYSVLQRFETGRLLACFEDATIRYFRILDDGKWDLQVQ